MQSRLKPQPAGAKIMRSADGLCLIAMDPKFNGGSVQMVRCDLKNAFGSAWVIEGVSAGSSGVQIISTDGGCLDTPERMILGGLVRTHLGLPFPVDSPQ